MKLLFRFVIAATSLLVFAPLSARAGHFDILELDNKPPYAPMVSEAKWTAYKEPILKLRLATADGKTTIQVWEDLIVKPEDVGIPTFALFFRSSSGEIFAMPVGKGDEVRTLNADSLVTLADVRYLSDDEWAKIASSIFGKGDPLKQGWEAAKPLEPRK